MKSIFVTFISFLVFVTGLTVYIYSNTNFYSSTNVVNSLPIKPFVVTYSYYKENGSPSGSYIIVRKVNSKGKSKTIKYKQTNGELQPLPEDKMLNIEFTSDEWANFSSAERLQSSPSFIKQDEILGFKVYVLRSNDLDPQVLETWYSIETGPIPLKIIFTTGDGRTLIHKAIKVEFREVTDEEVR